MKIYDCFPFFNELDLLEIRLQELWNSVDYFVLAESNMSHSGMPKEYFFENNKERFSQYMSKIRHIKVNDMPETDNSWIREHFQRDALKRGLHDLADDDIVIVSDCDEIPRAEAIDAIKNDENLYTRYILGIPMFQYKLNYMKIHERVKQDNIIVTRGIAFTWPQKEREFTFPWNTKPTDTVNIEHAGWHFTYLGDSQAAITKLQNFAHTEQNVPEIVDTHNVEWMVENKCGHYGLDNPERFEHVVLDDYFPEAIVNNKERWESLIIPTAEKTVYDFYGE